jgi:hypothetical protein
MGGSSQWRSGRYQVDVTQDGVEVAGGDPYKITIYCADQSHDDRRTIICVFNAYPPGSPHATPTKWDITVDDDTWVHETSSSGMDFRPLKWAAQAEQFIKDGQRLAGGEYPKEVPADSEPTYIRFKFRCVACHLPLECRDEKLYPILDTLEAAHLTEIELRSLAARLRSASAARKST